MLSICKSLFFNKSVHWKHFVNICILYEDNKYLLQSQAYFLITWSVFFPIWNLKQTWKFYSTLVDRIVPETLSCCLRHLNVIYNKYKYIFRKLKDYMLSIKKWTSHGM